VGRRTGRVRSAVVTGRLQLRAPCGPIPGLHRWAGRFHRHRARTSAHSRREMRSEQCEPRRVGAGASRERLKHVRQEHVVENGRNQHRARDGGRPRARPKPPAHTAAGRCKHPGKRLAPRRKLALLRRNHPIARDLRPAGPGRCSSCWTSSSREPTPRTVSPGPRASCAPSWRQARSASSALTISP
jgi:hypothetical protein